MSRNSVASTTWIFRHIDLISILSEPVYWFRDTESRKIHIYGTWSKQFPDRFQSIDFCEWSRETEYDLFHFMLQSGIIRHTVTYHA